MPAGFGAGAGSLTPASLPFIELVLRMRAELRSNSCTFNARFPFATVALHLGDHEERIKGKC